MNGTIVSQDGTITGAIHAEFVLSGHMHLPDGYESYKGEYEITPTVDKQIMSTKDKYMTDDVTINAVPIFNVTNPSGGTTIYIASEV